MTGFSIDWLDLREAADQRARDGKLLEQAMQWLKSASSSGPGMMVVDLGAGTGSTMRAFPIPASTERISLSWRLIDQDAGLLAEADLRHGGSQRLQIYRHGDTQREDTRRDTQRLQTYALDLADITALPLQGAHLITASALFDLVSTGFIEALAAALQGLCQQQPVGLYSTLNYDGTTRWTPPHPMDEAVLIAFNNDQHRDKGMGPALGPGAARYVERVFTRSGFKVLSAASPWILDGTDSKLVTALISGIGDAVARDPALDAASLQDWIQFRKAQVTTGTCIVGHTDLLALPGNDVKQ